MKKFIYFSVFSCILATFLGASLALPARAIEKRKQWALYSWIENEQWHYSLIHRTEHHPDDSEVKASATDSIDAIETRISLLQPGSDISLNPLPVLKMELHRPPFTTLKELERVCDNAKITWGSGN